MSKLGSAASLGGTHLPLFGAFKNTGVEVEEKVGHIRAESCVVRGAGGDTVAAGVATLEPVAWNVEPCCGEPAD